MELTRRDPQRACNRIAGLMRLDCKLSGAKKNVMLLPIAKEQIARERCKNDSATDNEAGPKQAFSGALVLFRPTRKLQHLEVSNESTQTSLVPRVDRQVRCHVWKDRLSTLVDTRELSWFHGSCHQGLGPAIFDPGYEQEIVMKMYILHVTKSGSPMSVCCSSMYSVKTSGISNDQGRRRVGRTRISCY